MKLNFVVAIKSNLSSLVVVDSYQDESLIFAQVTLHSLCTPNEGEALATLLGTKTTLDFNCPHVILKKGSLLVILSL